MVNVYKLIIWSVVIFLIGCDLVRDNPLDGKNSTQMKGGTNLMFSRYTVTSDNNGDGIVNKGESIQLQLYLKNTGTSTANKVRASISCTSSYVTGLSPTNNSFYYGGYNFSSSDDYIGSGKEGYDYNNKLSFTVSSSTPVGTVLTFNLNISDESGNTWTDKFTITVQGTGANIGFSRYTVTSDNNGDGIVNKGESIQLQLYLKNTGTSTANKVRASISCTSSYVSGLSPTNNSFYYGGYNFSSSDDYIGSGKEGYDYNNKLSFTVSSSTPVGTVLTFNLNISDESGNTWTDKFTITVQGTGANIGFSRYAVTSDNNGDGIVNKGESIQLQLYLKNTGTSTANKVRASISCTSSYVSGLSPTNNSFYYGGYNFSSSDDYIGSGKEGYDYNNKLSFTVSSSTPVGTVLTFNLNISDESGNTWTDIFTITVQSTGATIGFSRFSITSDNSGDGIVNKGESIKLQLYLKNTGTSTANKVRASISCTSSYVSGLSPTNNSFYYGGYNFSSSDDYIGSGKEGYDYNNKLSFTVSSSTPVGTVLTFNLNISDESGNTWTDKFSITVK